MNSQLIANSKTTLIESDNKNNNERGSSANYGTMNYETNDLNSNTAVNAPANEGWISKATNCAYNVGTGVVNYGYGGLKWAFSSTASVGTSVISAGAEGIVKIKRQTNKNKDE